MSNDPLVSIVIPVKNEGARLPTLLQSIESQTYPKIQTVVVDNFSTDGSEAMIASRVHRFIKKGPERSAQRNAGAQVADGDFVFFIDADMQLLPTVVEDCVNQIQRDAKVDAIIVPERSFGIGFWAHCKTLERECYIGDDSVEAPRFFRTERFRTLGGYDESLTGFEDWELTRRARKGGLRVDRIQTQLLHDEGRLSLFQTMRKKMYYARDFALFLERQKIDMREVLPIRPAFLRHWRKFARKPLHGIGAIFMKFCEAGAGAVGLAMYHASPSKRGTISG